MKHHNLLFPTPYTSSYPFVANRRKFQPFQPLKVTSGRRKAKWNLGQHSGSHMVPGIKGLRGHGTETFKYWLDWWTGLLTQETCRTVLRLGMPESSESPIPNTHAFRLQREKTWCSGWVQSLFSCAWLFATPGTVAHEAPLSMGFSRQEYWSELPYPPSGDLPNLGIKPASGSSPLAPPGKPKAGVLKPAGSLKLQISPHHNTLSQNLDSEGKIRAQISSSRRNGVGGSSPPHPTPGVFRFQWWQEEP